MEYSIKPLGNFIGYTDKAPLTRSDYEALAHPQSRAEKPVSDVVNISPDGNLQSFINSLTSGVGGGSGSFKLIGSLVPSADALGGSYGLYAGVGEVPYYKMKSLIDDYV